jgi:hypothetical protein
LVVLRIKNLAMSNPAEIVDHIERVNRLHLFETQTLPAWDMPAAHG